MEQIYLFTLRNDVWIYIACAFGLFWYGSEFLRAQRRLRRAVFGLERETGSRIRNNALLFITIFTAVAGFVFYVNTRIIPTLPAELLQPATATPDIFKTPLASPTPLSSPIPSSTPPLIPTITLAAQPDAIDSNQLTDEIIETPTIEPTAGPTATPAIACTLNLNISNPREGTTISGAITFSGTAVDDNFGGYRLEANGPQTGGQWASLLGRTIDQPVDDGILGSANLSQWESGPYLIRLVVVNQGGADVGICVTQITLNN